MGVQLDRNFVTKASRSLDRQDFGDGSKYFQPGFVFALSKATGVRLALEGDFLAGFLPNANYVEPEGAQRRLVEAVRCCCYRHHVVQLYCDQVPTKEESP